MLVSCIANYWKRISLFLLVLLIGVSFRMHFPYSPPPKIPWNFKQRGKKELCSKIGEDSFKIVNNALVTAIDFIKIMFYLSHK